jgi:hypothetical protein
MWTDNGWLEYQLQAVQDELLEQDAQAAEDASAVVKVRTALLERDEALQKARKDTAAMRTVAAEWETEVASIRARSNRTVQPSREHGLGRARPRKGPRRPSS